jgi:hypothetical protein
MASNSIYYISSKRRFTSLGNIYVREILKENRNLTGKDYANIAGQLGCDAKTITVRDFQTSNQYCLCCLFL